MVLKKKAFWIFDDKYVIPTFLSVASFVEHCEEEINLIFYGNDFSHVEALFAKLPTKNVLNIEWIKSDFFTIPIHEYNIPFKGHIKNRELLFYAAQMDRKINVLQLKKLKQNMVIDIDKHIQLSYENVKKNEALAAVHTFEYDKRTYIGLNTVFSPAIFQDAYFFTQHLPAKKGGRFLEVGCGSGLIAVNAALKGFESVVATDINPYAIKNTKINALLHDVDHQLTAFTSDVFDAIDKETYPAFDTIFWNTPFINEGRKAISDLEKSVFGDYTQGLSKYVSMAKSFLTEQGQVFIGFSSTCGDIDLLSTICEQNGAFMVLIAEHPIFEITLELYEIRYK